MMVSYSATLAEELAVKQRRLVFGHWFQSLWGDRVKPVPDQSSRANFANTAGGARISCSIESGILGRGATTHVYDDLMTIKEAESDLERQSILRSMSEALPTRLNNSATAARILVGQRVGEDDPTNLALESWPDAVHLMFPMEFEVNRCCPQDRRTYEGELICPEIWPAIEVEKLKKGLMGLEKGQNALSSYAVSCLLQQSPVPRGGSVIDPLLWQVWPEVVPQVEDLKRDAKGEIIIQLPELDVDDYGRPLVIVSVDTAYSEREVETASLNAIVTLGVWSRAREEVTRDRGWHTGSDRWGTFERDPVEETGHPGEVFDQRRVVLMEVSQGQWPLNDPTPNPLSKRSVGIGLVQRVADVCRRRSALRVVIEDMTRGRDLAHELRRELRDFDIEVELIRPAGSKLSRMHSIQPLFAQKLIYSPGKPVPGFDKFGRPEVKVEELQWVQELVRQSARTPRGRQDGADALSQGLMVLRRDGWLQLQPEYIRHQLEARAWRPRAGSVGRDIARSYGVG
jgi:hypothetical protein